ncbi:MAG: acetoacetate decarboxylase family protein [Myxococcota bacterium]
MESAENSPRTYSIGGRLVGLPVEVREARSGAATYLVRAEAARRLLPGPELDVVELLPGRALCSLAAIDYRDNDLGDYNEVSIAFFVRERRAPRGLPYVGTLRDVLRGRSATYIHRLPVDQSFTCEAGRTIWGFPKTVEQIDIDYEERHIHCRLVVAGEPVLSLTLPRGGKRTLPETELTTYSYIEGVLHRTSFRSAAEGVGFGVAGGRLELGSHPIADELRALGLPRRPLMTVWMERMRGCFEPAEKV